MTAPWYLPKLLERGLLDHGPEPGIKILDQVFMPLHPVVVCFLQFPARFGLRPDTHILLHLQRIALAVKRAKVGSIIAGRLCGDRGTRTSQHQT